MHDMFASFILKLSFNFLSHTPNKFEFRPRGLPDLSLKVFFFFFFFFLKLESGKYLKINGGVHEMHVDMCEICVA
jgi:hypothetical protein